jgi:hypothetical protein
VVRRPIYCSESRPTDEHRTRKESICRLARFPARRDRFSKASTCREARIRRAARDQELALRGRLEGGSLPDARDLCAVPITGAGRAGSAAERAAREAGTDTLIIDSPGQRAPRWAAGRQRRAGVSLQVKWHDRQQVMNRHRKSSPGLMTRWRADWWTGLGVVGAVACGFCPRRERFP